MVGGLKCIRLWEIKHIQRIDSLKKQKSLEGRFDKRERWKEKYWSIYLEIIYLWIFLNKQFFFVAMFILPAISAKNSNTWAQTCRMLI